MIALTKRDLAKLVDVTLVTPKTDYVSVSTTVQMRLQTVYSLFSSNDTRWIHSNRIEWFFCKFETCSGHVVIIEWNNPLWYEPSGWQSTHKLTTWTYETNR